MARGTHPLRLQGESSTNQKPGTFWGRGEAQLRTEALVHNPIITLQTTGALRSFLHSILNLWWGGMGGRFQLRAPALPLL